MKPLSRMILRVVIPWLGFSGLLNILWVQVTTSSGKKEHKEILLADHDPIWMEMRDLHIADVSELELHYCYNILT